MTSSERSVGAKGKSRRDPACDPGLLDDLKCKARGIQAQAEYNAAHAVALDTAKLDFDKARDAYNTARAAAEPIVKEARRQLDDLVERVRCQLDPADVDCLDRAYAQVVERLRKCGAGGGCCSDGDCDDDDEVRDCDPDDVPGHIADITRRTAEATECFASLIREPVAAVPDTAPTKPDEKSAAAYAKAPEPSLPDRVEAVRTEIAEIAKAVAEAAWEPTKLYAAVLVARLHLDGVWHGFANVNDYMDCLCHALTCMIKGHAAIGELTRKAAVNACYRESWRAACKRLQTHTVAEVLAEYLRVCAEDEEDCDPDEVDDHHDGEHEPPEQPEEPPHRPPSRPRPDDGGYSGSGERPGGGPKAGRPAGRPRRPYRNDSGGYRAP
jgi:hypothetical protein